MGVQVSQWALIVLSGASAWAFVTGRRRLGCGLGLASEPFWGWCAWEKELWSVLILSFWYAGSYAYGLYKRRERG